MAETACIRCEVAYARPDRQFLAELTLPAGAVARDALVTALQAGWAASCPEIVVRDAVLGIFGRVVAADQVLREGDRVEVYRPLLRDPKVARRDRAAPTRSGRK